MKILGLCGRGREARPARGRVRGRGYNLALTSDGAIFAWGYNGWGQLGDGSTVDRHAPVTVSGLSGVIAVSACVEHSLALRGDGTVFAWGNNYYGQLGVSNPNPAVYWRLAPVPVPGVSGVIAIAAAGIGGGKYQGTLGIAHSLALKSDGTVLAWGRNADRQLGDGTATDRRLPVPVLDLSGVTAIAANNWYSVVIRR